MQFPDEGLVYDYCLDDGGISKIGEDEEETENISIGLTEVCFNHCHL